MITNLINKLYPCHTPDPGLRHPPESQVVIPKASISHTDGSNKIYILHKINNTVQSTDLSNPTPSVTEGIIYMLLFFCDHIMEHVHAYCLK